MCTILRSAGAHRLELGGLAGCGHPRRRPVGKRLDRGAASVPVAGCVDGDVQPWLVHAVENRSGKLLDRVDRLPALADREAELAAMERPDEGLGALPDRYGGLDLERVANELEVLLEPSAGLGELRVSQVLGLRGERRLPQAARRRPGR